MTLQVQWKVTTAFAHHVMVSSLFVLFVLCLCCLCCGQPEHCTPHNKIVCVARLRRADVSSMCWACVHGLGCDRCPAMHSVHSFNGRMLSHTEVLLTLRNNYPPSLAWQCQVDSTARVQAANPVVYYKLCAVQLGVLEMLVKVVLARQSGCHSTVIRVLAALLMCLPWLLECAR